MERLSKDKIVRFLRQILFVAAIIFAASFLQFYWSMGHLSERMSSSCLECWFVEDAFYMSSITAVLLAIIFRFLNKIRSKIFIIVIQFLLLITIWSFWDYSVFVDRESSWSTYLFNEELYYVGTYSILPILILSFLSIFLINYKLFIKTK
ncbi:hypothetical protein [Epilithonimonas lactis]|uniref:Uncharacterized protein n=1 Tax=Epilithonimonas lactis TaxID=421072 RepID=A0A085BFV4_9FLAO|nr:hypothetical protein [Epilithonimonas lactis]KFC21349.1 hypothetical protein IO89_14260 [Epilithonimonas lactis]SEP82204.1 hypothetical protein SAMN04488097_0758 [Epilithonimonas lactis]